MAPGWVAVALADPTCTEAGGTLFETRIKISPTGYGCTSIPAVEGHVVEHYYQETSDGSLRKLRLDREIFVPATTEIRSGTCHVFAETFWYGPKEKMQGDPSEVIRKHRRECQ